MAEDKNTRASQPVLKIKKWGERVSDVLNFYEMSQKKKRESKERGNRVETLQPKGIIKKCWKTNFSDFSRPTSIFFSHRSGFVVLFVYSGLL